MASGSNYGLDNLASFGKAMDGVGAFAKSSLGDMSKGKGFAGMSDNVDDGSRIHKGDIQTIQLTASDERLKNLFGEDAPIEAFSKINSYMYKYKPEAQDKYDGQYGIDDSVHFGPMAQELAENPVTEGTVHPNEDGYLTVDTRQLTLTNTAMISQLARKIQELEERIGGTR